MAERLIIQIGDSEHIGWDVYKILCSIVDDGHGIPGGFLRVDDNGNKSCTYCYNKLTEEEYEYPFSVYSGHEDGCEIQELQNWLRLYKYTDNTTAT